VVVQGLVREPKSVQGLLVLWVDCQGLPTVSAHRACACRRSCRVPCVRFRWLSGSP
jgi:hypothetical protein